MDKITLPSDETKMMSFQGDNYVLNVPCNWLIVRLDEKGIDEKEIIGFLGPKVGSLRTGFFIGEIPNDQSCQALAEQRVAVQAQEAENFRLLDRTDVSGEGFSAVIQAVRFFNSKADVVVYRRRMFIEINGRMLEMFSTIPNTPHLDAFNQLFTKMFNSFRVGQIVYTPQV